MITTLAATYLHWLMREIVDRTSCTNLHIEVKFTGTNVVTPIKNYGTVAAFQISYF